MKRLILAYYIFVLFASCGCATPAKAHYAADRAYLDGSGKKLLKYVDADEALDPASKALYHADWETFDAEVRHAQEDK